MLCSNLRSSRSSIFCTNSVLPGFTPAWGFFRFVFSFCFFLVVLVFFFKRAYFTSDHDCKVSPQYSDPLQHPCAYKHAPSTYDTDLHDGTLPLLCPANEANYCFIRRHFCTMLSLDPCRNCSGKVMNPFYQLKACYRHPYYQQQPRCSNCPQSILFTVPSQREDRTFSPVMLKSLSGCSTFDKSSCEELNG